MNNEEQKKYFEQVNDFITFARKNNEELEKLSNSINGLSDRLQKLRSIEQLNNCLSELDININKIDDCSKSLKSVFADVEKVESINDGINVAKSNFNIISGKIENINKDLNQLVDSASNINLDNINNKITELCNLVQKSNDTMQIQIIDVLNNNLKTKIAFFETEINNMKTIFEEYKKNSDIQIQTLIQSNEDLRKELQKNMETNTAIIQYFKAMKETNVNVEQFLNDTIEKWYDRNISFLGRRKKTTNQEDK